MTSFLILLLGAAIGAMTVAFVIGANEVSK